MQNPESLKILEKDVVHFFVVISGCKETLWICINKFNEGGSNGAILSERAFSMVWEE